MLGGSVAKFDFCDEIEKLSPIKSMSVRQAKLVISCKVKVLAWNSKE